MHSRFTRFTRRIVFAVLAAVALSFSGVAVATAPASAGVNCGEAPYNQFIPEGFFSASFSQACLHHDICYWGGLYGYPWKGKRADCDWAFYTEMVNVCKATYTWFTDPRQAWCTQQAGIYYSAVRAIGWSYWAGKPADNN